MHIGQIIKQELEEQGRTVVWFAKKMSYTRSNDYKILTRATLDTEVLLRISQLLGVDFFQYYTDEMKKDNI